MQDNQPTLVIFAGPNGSGKSTITTNFQQKSNFPANYINPDEIALTLNEENPNRRAYQAAIIASEQRQNFISQGESFAFETVMSHPSKLKLFEQAKEAGYQVELVFIATSDPEVNVNRVRQRVTGGGHDVPADKIRSRYQRSIDLLPIAAEIADRVSVYDNTQRPERKLTIENSAITYKSKNTPNWVQDTITKLESRLNDRQVIASTNELPVNSANIDEGKYVGSINQITDNYVVQKTGDNLTLHDRSIVKGDFQLGEDFRIAYKDGNVSASIQPTKENQQWAQSIFQAAYNIFQTKSNQQQVEMPSRGIELVRDNNYEIQLNRNNNTLTISSNDDNRRIAAYDLEEGLVIASEPTSLDKERWQLIEEQVTQIAPAVTASVDFMVNEFGEVQEDGSIAFSSENYNFLKVNDSITVERKSDGAEILKDGRFTPNASDEDIENMEKVKSIAQEYADELSESQQQQQDRGMSL